MGSGFGDATPVTNIRLADLVVKMAGICRGSRSGVALQRGWQAVELGSLYIDSARNRPMDIEPARVGTARHCERPDLPASDPA